MLLASYLLSVSYHRQLWKWWLQVLQEHSEPLTRTKFSYTFPQYYWSQINGNQHYQIAAIPDHFTLPMTIIFENNSMIKNPKLREPRILIRPPFKKLKWETKNACKTFSSYKLSANLLLLYHSKNKRRKNKFKKGRCKN